MKQQSKICLHHGLVLLNERDHHNIKEIANAFYKRLRKYFNGSTSDICSGQRQSVFFCNISQSTVIAHYTYCGCADGGISQAAKAGRAGSSAHDTHNVYMCSDRRRRAH